MDWTYPWGDKKVQVTLEGISDAIDTSCSLITKELAYNDVIKNSEHFRPDYERKLEILRVVQRNLLEAFGIMERETVHFKIPSKRRK